MMRSCFAGLALLLSLVMGAQTETPSTVATALQRRLQSLALTDSVLVNVVFRQDEAAKTTTLKKAYQSTQTTLQFLRGKLAKKDLLLLSRQPGVCFISEAHAPHEELNTGAVDYTLNKINLAHQRYPALAGDGVAVLVKERAFDSTDIDLRGRVLRTGLQAPTVTTHASLMATIVAGAGNSSPLAKGVAPGAVVGSTDFANLFPASDAFYRQQKISVENHSYGTIVENFYGPEAVAHDASAVSNETLLHVFSAGNSGTATPTAGTYNGLAGVANLTGNFKQSKNTLSVTALDSAGNAMTAASKGPAYDGRLKPELSAYGEDGSSGAAALVSGTAALVQDAVKRTTGTMPSSELVKAVLLNSADDAGQPGPDYTTGYGSLNAAKAVETVLQNRTFTDSVAQGGAKRFSLNVPANIRLLKVTLCWRDAPAAPNAAKALVNDLDGQLTTSGNTWLPWVLNPSPSLAALQAPAQRKVDTLNVVEQITVDDPAAGVYEIEVRGKKVTGGMQSFAIAYQFDTANVFQWTYPTAADPLVTGRRHRLRWQTNYTGNAEVEYATAGNNWRRVGTVANVATGSLLWTVPDTTTLAVLRVRIGNAVVLSDSFVVAPVLNLQTGFACADSFLLYWNGASSNRYAVYHLPGAYLQPFREVADTALLLRTAQAPSLHYSVAPLVGGRPGLRSQTLNYTAQGVGCYVKAFFLQSQSATAAFFTAEIGTSFNVQAVALERLTNGSFVAVKTITAPSSLLLSFSDELQTQGENRYRLRVTLQNGVVVYSNVEVVYHLPESPVVVYPNPARQGSVITILAKEAGRYGLQVVDANGRMVQAQPLNSSRTRFLSVQLPKGLYYLRITDAQGEPFTQKLVVY